MLFVGILNVAEKKNPIINIINGSIASAYSGVYNVFIINLEPNINANENNPYPNIPYLINLEYLSFNHFGSLLCSTNYGIT